MQRSRRKNKKKPGRGSIDVSLNITPMADIFTILLVFLIKTYTTSSINLNPSQGVRLPVANAAESQMEALKVEISSNAISIENQAVVELTDYKLPYGENPEQALKNLSSQFEMARKRQDLISSSNDDVKQDSKVLILSDQDTPYSMVKLVLGTAAMHGYTDFKMAILREGQ